MSKSFSSERFLQRCNYIFMGLSVVFLLDFLLPSKQVNTTITASYYTKISHPGTTYRPSSSKTYVNNITIETRDGKILVAPFDKYVNNKRFGENGEPAVLKKTRIFGVGQSLIVPSLGNLERKTTKPAYGKLMFFPYVFIFLGLVVSLTSNNWIILNIGSLNLVLVGIYLALLFTNVGNIGLNEY